MGFCFTETWLLENLQLHKTIVYGFPNRIRNSLPDLMKCHFKGEEAAAEELQKSFLNFHLWVALPEQAGLHQMTSQGPFPLQSLCDSAKPSPAPNPFFMLYQPHCRLAAHTSPTSSPEVETIDPRSSSLSLNTQGLAG